MNRLDQERLLREALTDDALDVIRTKSLARGVSELKAKRRIRTLVSGVTATVVVLTALTLSRGPKQSPASRAAEVSSSSVPARAIKIIDDEQLLALFPTRSIALVGAPGRQELIFLDEPEGRPAWGK